MPVITAHRTTTDERLGASGAIIMLIAVVALVLATWSGLLSTPNHVERVTLDNPHNWTADVEARRAGSDGWTAIGTLGPHVRREYLEVLDMAHTWELRFRSPGSVVDVRTTMTRDQLINDNWSVVVPPSLATAATAANLPPSPAEP